MNIRAFYKTFLFIVLATLSTKASQAQDEKPAQDEKSAQLKAAIDSRNYIFVAQQALPAGGRSVNLTSVYDLRIKGDSIISDLPFFGRAYVAPMTPSEGGIKFTSTQYSYNMKEGKKGGWEVSILPKDTKDVRQLYLRISEKGYASLSITNLNRSPINFNGYVTVSKKQ